MFFVFDKKKIYSYLVAVCTVVILFVIATTFTNGKTVETAATESKKLPIYSVKTEDKKIALTMNCAWDAEDIDSILTTLEKCNVKITFFMVGDWVEKYPEAVKKISDKGHEIANHSNTHPHVNQLSLEKNREEIKACNEKIEKITGKIPILYRGPYGEYNNTVVTAAEEEKMKTIQWSLDTLDYSGLTGEQMWNRLDGKLEPGSIILTHNGTKHTKESLEMILTKIKEQGYQVVTVSNLIYQDNYAIDSTGKQYRK